MVSSERRSFSSSTGSTAAGPSSSPDSGSYSSSTSGGVGGSGGADRMVKEELEAAEALAVLAHLAMRESSGAESAGHWGQKGKRARKRVKSESPPSRSGLNPLDTPPTCPDLLPQDQAVTGGLQQCEMVCTNVLTEPVKTEQVLSEKVVKAEHDTELNKPSPICTTIYPSFTCSKSRRNLTEEEKEERRIRRIMANRESARQTIRRRQALCEELTRKAADLALENENLKRKKELAVKEFQSLEKTNKHLKVQMAKVTKAEDQEAPAKNMSAYVQMQIPPSSPTNSPFFLFNRPPFTPLFWPPVIQSSNSIQVQHVLQNPTAVLSNISLPANGTAESSLDQENPPNINGARTPLYVFPCPWFIPHFDNGNGLQPQSSLCLNNKQEETSFNNQYSSSSSSGAATQLDNHQPSLPVRLKTEDSASNEGRPSHDLNETPAQFPLDEGDQHTGPHPKENGCKEIFVSPSSLNHAGVASCIKHENGFEPDYTVTVDNSYHKFSALPEKNSEPIVYPTGKLADAIAAAEARKRRKKLTKLKNLHGRQCRTQC
ncbi:transcriptional activator hacA-like [Pyrus ussuriensis x Pyrus communis]|uniref:Transcriptional activator hacA-like n=1 Tax=Pyrus ussuriensis x Pyrus communis TaxID=2448454 RepID=A0A5N5FXZ0_9ROSA|nr:transcriptional activator hacA-like [Pyrus ussuriensis x Pyrus communis]